MFCERRLVYRCSFCRRFTKFRPATVADHEGHCRKNPSRTPFIGELTFADAGGMWIHDISSSTGWAWRPYTQLPEWWPGAPGMIYAADGWHPVPGYSNVPAVMDHDSDRWPYFDGMRLSEIRPFWRRVVLLGFELDDWHAARMPE